MVRRPIVGNHPADIRTRSRREHYESIAGSGIAHRAGAAGDARCLGNQARFQRDGQQCVGRCDAETRLVTTGFDDRGPRTDDYVAAMRALWTALEVPRTQAIGLANLFTRIGSDAAAFKAGQDRFAAGERPQWRLR